MRVKNREAAFGLDDVVVPDFTLLDFNRRQGSEDLYLRDVFDWIGALHVRVETFLSPPSNQRELSLDNFVSSFFPDADMFKTRGHIAVSSVVGLIAPAAAAEKLRMLRSIVESGRVPFAVLSVWGFEHAPVSWSKNEHWSLGAGENDYTFVVLPHDNYLLYRSVGESDATS